MRIRDNNRNRKNALSGWALLMLVGGLYALITMAVSPHWNTAKLVFESGWPI